MDFLVYWIVPDSGYVDRIHAEISLRQEVAGMEEREGAFGFYVPATHEGEFSAFLAGLQEETGLSFRVERLNDQNWNAVWESQFEPVTLDNWIHIRADFHPPASGTVEHELIINPANAFGTGHHETTRLILTWLRYQDLTDATILDFGAGTGILGIVTYQLGASTVVGIDIRPEAVESMQSNAVRNEATIIARKGSAEVIGEDLFDVVIANVNLDVLQMHALKLTTAVRAGGRLVVSGILSGDDRAILQAYPAIHWDWMNQEGEWIAMAGHKP